MGQSLRIAILGAGNVGGALGRVWAGKGHAITYGVPDPNSERVKQTVQSLRGKGHAVSNAEACSGADVVVLSVPWPAAQDALRTAGDLSGKVLIDCTNPLSADLQGLVIGCTTSAAEQVAGWAPKAKVVKAFNTIGAVNFGNANFGGQAADGFYCGDDSGAKNAVRPLIEDAGLNPVDVGPLRSARMLEPLAMLWIDLAINRKQGPNHGFKLLRR